MSKSPTLARLSALAAKLNIAGTVRIEAFDNGRGGVSDEYVLRASGVTYRLGSNRESAAAELRAHAAK